MTEHDRARILETLERAYGEETCALRFGDPFELLVATILSAQCTDRQVNLVTGPLFARFHAPADLAALAPEELEPWIRSCGTYRIKARSIVFASRGVVERFGGRVPETLEELTSLPGVGRKTANVVLSNAFGRDAIAVDTHVFRVANRLGLARAANVLETERQLMDAIPRDKWSRAHHWLIWHGRRVCAARRPRCAGCPLAQWCEHRRSAAGSGNEQAIP